MRLHFFSNDPIAYHATKKHFFRNGPMWELIQDWVKIGKKLGLDIVTGVSELEPEINEYIYKCTGQNHPIPSRHRTIIKVNDKLVYFDCQDPVRIGADLEKVPNLFDLCIKFQYSIVENYYNNMPFKVVPFTYFTPLSDKHIRQHRKIRLDTINNKNFLYSIIFGYQTNDGLKVRRKIYDTLLQMHKTKIGYWPQNEYHKYLTESIVAATARGTGELCHRDIECLGIGVPFFRKDIPIITQNPLIPNIHYYSIGGDELGIDKVLNYYTEFFEPNGIIKQFTEKEWNDYNNIINNGIEWYEKNSTRQSSLITLIKIIQEHLF